MNVETIVTRADPTEYYGFGWQKTGTNEYHVGRSHLRREETILSRDKDMEHYDLICALEKKYFAAKDSKKYYEPIDPWIVILCFLLFVIPGVIYLVVKNNQYQDVIEWNVRASNIMESCLKEAKTLLP